MAMSQHITVMKCEEREENQGWSHLVIDSGGGVRLGREIRNGGRSGSSRGEGYWRGEGGRCRGLLGLVQWQVLRKGA